MVKDNVISAKAGLTIEGTTNSFGEAVAYFKEGDKWVALGRGPIDSYESRPPYPYKIVVPNPPKNVREIVVCNDKAGIPPNDSQSPPVYL